MDYFLKPHFLTFKSSKNPSFCTRLHARGINEKYVV